MNILMAVALFVLLSLNSCSQNQQEATSPEIIAFLNGKIGLQSIEILLGRYTERDVDVLAKFISSQDLVTKERAILALGYTRNKRAVFYLKKILEDENEDYSIKLRALEALLIMPPEIIEPIVKEWLNSGNRDAQVTAMFIVGMKGDAEEAKPIFDLLQANEINISDARTLLNVEPGNQSINTNYIKEILRRLKSPIISQRDEGITACGNSPFLLDESIIDPLLNIITSNEALSEDQKDSILYCLFAISLSELGNPHNGQGFIKPKLIRNVYIETDVEEWKKWWSQNGQTFKMLARAKKALGDENSRIKSMAIGKYNYWKDPSVTPSLVQVLQSNIEYSDITLDVILALSTQADRESCSALLDAFENGDEQTSQFALIYLLKVMMKTGTYPEELRKYEELIKKRGIEPKQKEEISRIIANWIKQNKA